MRRSVWIAGTLPALVSLSAWWSPSQLSDFAARVTTNWWVLLLASSFLSLLLLSIAASPGGVGGARHLGSVSAGAYLVPGTSMVAFNVISGLSLGSSPPAWAGAFLLLLLLISAWVYYQVSRGNDGQ